MEPPEEQRHRVEEVGGGQSLQGEHRNARGAATEDREANGQPERVGTGGRLASGGGLRRVRRSGRQRAKEEGMRRRRRGRLWQGNGFDNRRTRKKAPWTNEDGLFDNRIPVIEDHTVRAGDPIFRARQPPPWPARCWSASRTCGASERQCMKTVR